MEQSLKGVPETQLVTLWARAVETKRLNPIIKDEKAIEIMDKIEYNFSKFDKEWPTQTGIAVRTEILDKSTKNFLSRHPYAVIINLGCGLDTRFSRLDNGKIRWHDLDLPETIHIRKQFFEETDRYKMITRSVFDYSWVNEINADNKPVLIIAEGILMFFTEQEVKDLINKLVTTFKGAEMLFDIMPPLLIEQIKKYNTKFQKTAPFKWGIENGKEMERFNTLIEFIAEWTYFDYHKHRWEKMHLDLNSAFSSRIIHLKF